MRTTEAHSEQDELPEEAHCRGNQETQPRLEGFGS